MKYKTYLVLSLIAVITLANWHNGGIGGIGFTGSLGSIGSDLLDPLTDAKDNDLYTVLHHPYPPALMLLAKWTPGKLLDIFKHTASENFTRIALASLMASTLACFTIYALKKTKKVHCSPRKESLALIFTALLVCSPPALLMIERANMLIFVVLAIFLITGLSTVNNWAAAHITELMIIAGTAGMFIKPYMILMVAALIFIKAKGILDFLCSFAIIIITYAAINALAYYIGKYDGTIMNWIESIKDFRNNTYHTNITNGYFMRYYSVSIGAISSAFPAKSLAEYIQLVISRNRQVAHEYIWIDMLLASMLGIFTTSLLVQARKIVSIAGLNNESQCKIATLIATTMMPLAIVNIIRPESGFYINIFGVMSAVLVGSYTKDSLASLIIAIILLFGIVFGSGVAGGIYAPYMYSSSYSGMLFCTMYAIRNDFTFIYKLGTSGRDVR